MSAKRPFHIASGGTKPFAGYLPVARAGIRVWCLTCFVADGWIMQHVGRRMDAVIRQWDRDFGDDTKGDEK